MPLERGDVGIASDFSNNVLHVFFGSFFSWRILVENVLDYYSG